MTEPVKYDVKLSDMNYELMQPLLNDVFGTTSEQGAAIEVTLVEVEKRAEKKPTLHSWQKPKVEVLDENSEKRLPFTLVFRFPVEPEALQGSYYITHPNEGVFERVFLTPIASDEDGLYLEAIFN